MDLALQSALIGAALGAAVLTVVILYGWSQVASPGLGWWAVGFLLETLSRGILLLSDRPWAQGFSDFQHALGSGAILAGILIYGGRPLRPPAMIFGLLLVMGWTGVASAIRIRWGISGIPLFGVGGFALGVTAWILFKAGARASWSNLHRPMALICGLAALHQALAPLLHAVSAMAVISLMLAQFFSILIAVMLLLLLLRGQQVRADSEGRRADVLQRRLLSALSNVQDGIALYDETERLLTCNGRYRDVLSPIGDRIHPGATMVEVFSAAVFQGVFPEAVGHEERWILERKEWQDSTDARPREMRLWDGRWIAIHQSRTADGGYLIVLRDISPSKLAESALSDSLAWLRGIMNSVVDGLVTIDGSGTILSFNTSAQRIFGYDAVQVVGRNVRMLLPEFYRPEHDLSLQRYIDGHPSQFIGSGRRVQGLRADGSIFPMELSVTELRQDDNLTFIGVVRDITDRKKVEDALVASEQRFRDLAESASDWFWEVDANLRFTFVSGRVRQILGVGAGFYIGRALADLAASSTRDNMEWSRHLSLMARHRPFRGFVFQQTLPTGIVKYIEMAGRPIFDPEGRFLGYRGIASDVTPLKRHERELATQAQLRQAIIDNLGQGVVVFDASENAVAVNRTARDLLDWARLFPDPAELKLSSMLERLVAHGEFGSEGARREKWMLHQIRRHPDRMMEHVRPSGQILEIRSSGMPDGGVIVTFSDITDRKRVEETLRQAKDAAERGNRAKDTFLANISHELRTPLNAIIGFSELMLHGIFGRLEPCTYRNYVEDIHGSGMHLLELINDILDMSKAEAGMTQLVDTLVDIGGLVRSCVRLMARRAQASGVELVVEIPNGLPLLRADERRLRQIVLNLLSNAVKFTDDGGRVRIRSEAGEGGLVLDVEDNGIGMTPEELQQVMEPFVQADSRLSRKYEGTGLGLPLARALVEAHGGVLTLTSTVGVGTMVRLTFPPERVVRLQ